MILIIAMAAGMMLAYANGANDNFKGVATLFGSKTTSYRTALIWATVATFLGSLAALVLAGGLIATFSGKGLAPDSVVASVNFPAAVAMAAALTVFLASLLGFPISTTHALIGALIGAGWIASPQGLELSRLGKSFVLPLLLSPVLAVFFTYVSYPVLRFFRIKLGVEKETIVCLETETAVPVANDDRSSIALFRAPVVPRMRLSNPLTREGYSGEVLGVSAEKILDKAHFLSAGIVSFARGLNDTPKIAALLLVTGTLSTTAALILVGVFIAIGGLLNARKVADTISVKMVDMNAGQGFTANLMTGLIVILASRFGLPVSTTHVSCGALIGIGAVTGGAHWRKIGEIFMAWLITLPLAMMLGYICFLVLKEPLS